MRCFFLFAIRDAVLVQAREMFTTENTLLKTAAFLFEKWFPFSVPSWHRSLASVLCDSSCALFSAKSNGRWLVHTYLVEIAIIRTCRYSWCSNIDKIPATPSHLRSAIYIRVRVCMIPGYEVFSVLTFSGTGRKAAETRKMRSYHRLMRASSSTTTGSSLSMQACGLGRTTPCIVLRTLNPTTQRPGCSVWPTLQSQSL